MPNVRMERTMTMMGERFFMPPRCRRRSEVAWQLELPDWGRTCLGTLVSGCRSKSADREDIARGTPAALGTVIMKTSTAIVVGAVALLVAPAFADKSPASIAKKPNCGESFDLAPRRAV